MNSIFSAFHAIFSAGIATVGIIVSSVIPHHPAMHIASMPSISPVPQVTQETATPTASLTPTKDVQTPTLTGAPKTIIVQKTIVTMGKHVTIFLSLPEHGGRIDGNVSGDCQGAIDGVYTQPTYTFNGNGEITCTIGFLSLPANASFSGLVHPDKKTVSINYSVSSGSNFSKSGNIVVPYTER